MATADLHLISRGLAPARVVAFLLAWHHTTDAARSCVRHARRTAGSRLPAPLPPQRTAAGRFGEHDARRPRMTLRCRLSCFTGSVLALQHQTLGYRPVVGVAGVLGDALPPSRLYNDVRLRPAFYELPCPPLRTAHFLRLHFRRAPRLRDWRAVNAYWTFRRTRCLRRFRRAAAIGTVAFPGWCFALPQPTSTASNLL